MRNKAKRMPVRFLLHAILGSCLSSTLVSAEEHSSLDCADGAARHDLPSSATPDDHRATAAINHGRQYRRPAVRPRLDAADETHLGFELTLGALSDMPLNLGMLSAAQDETAAIDLAEDQSAPAGGGQTDLAAASQNPIANTISVPFENNFFFHSGEDDETTYVLNFQPVIPIQLNEDWNFISRPIIPVMYVPGAVPGLPGIGGMPVGFNSEFGLGDINYTGFFSPAKSDKLIWGFGPSITFPTATDDVLGSGKWSAGPSFVGLTIQKPIVAGVLLRQLWSFAGKSDRQRVNQSLIQPFLNYNLDDGWYLITAPVITADWAAEGSRNRWTVPLGGGVGKLFTVGGQPINMNLQVYYSVARPDNASDWQLKFTFQLLFPK